jgi:hypothetical protein
VLAAIRKKKSEHNLSAGAALELVTLRNNEGLEQKLGLGLSDLRAAAKADALRFVDDSFFDIDILPKVVPSQERGA